jgi:glycosyltransferase involved in cell wall biosynthesis
LKVTHIITGLSAHGAETMLYRLLSASNPQEYQNEVISLTDRGALGDKIESLGVPVRVLGMRPGIPNPMAVLKLAKMLRESRPALVQTWMYHADLLGGLAARVAGDIPVVWGIHHTRIDRRETKLLTFLTVKFCAWLSWRVPACIVCCSNASEEAHVELGYPRDKMRVITNGIDVEQFQPDAEAGAVLRNALGIPNEALLIGLAARLHPHKDHKTFFRAAGLLHKEFPDVHFVLCGDGVVRENPEIAAEVAAAELEGYCHLLGARSDMQRIYPALDIAANSSLSEAFPLALGEAMACGVTCVATDVGDCAAIIGDTGKIVPPQRPELLANAWREVLQIGPEARRRLGAAARARVASHFSLPAVVGDYQGLYRTINQEASGFRSASVVEQEPSAASAKSARDFRKINNTTGPRGAATQYASTSKHNS